jgi:hypothetical protein
MQKIADVFRNKYGLNHSLHFVGVVVSVPLKGELNKLDRLREIIPKDY